jgi:hypothetical protein
MKWAGYITQQDIAEWGHCSCGDACTVVIEVFKRNLLS